MPHVTVTLDPTGTISPVRRRTFGGFVEHMGRGVYTGIFEESHPSADDDGFRGDVLELVRELGVTTVRYPGGNFVSGYRWEDGIGPREHRPRRLDLAWRTIEPNTVGVDEFMRWCAKAGVEPMMAVNLGTRGVQEALDLLEYCTVPHGTALSDLRVANGAPQPHRIGMWCLGNEMDGPWQVGHKTAHEYGRLAAETARAMRKIEPGLELVVCGSSGRGMPTFGEWERVVLEETYDLVDHVSAHAYYWETDGDLAGFLASPLDMQAQIDAVVATADAVRARTGSAKQMSISFDEWNVWYMHDGPEAGHEGWPVAPPLLEDRYHVADAVVVGGLLMTLLRNSDRVHAASLAQLVNVIAPIVTEPGGRAWRQTTFHPFALTARHAKGAVLRADVDAPVHETKHGDTPLVDVVATDDGEDLVLFVVNRSLDGPTGLDVDVRAFGPLTLTEAVTLSGPPYRKATADAEVAPEPLAVTVGEAVRAELPPVSWSMIRLARTR